ncbi:MAG: ferric reductase-like transmembrane domain-containing protein [Proteobacteria bacterium]|nr:ferric reductase-like transmembrane domain-containing protein [Pseudomonadota bacterium]
MTRGKSIIILFAGLVLLAPVLETFQGVEHETFLSQLGKNFGLAGFMLLVFQVFLAARIKWIERPFGFDILIRFHRHMAFLALGLLAAHALLMAAGTGKWEFIFGLDLPFSIWLGKAALFLVAANILATSFQTRLKIKFERWRAGHDILAPAILAAVFFHAFLGVGEDVLELAAIQAHLALFTTAAASLYVWHLFLRPWLLKRHPFTVIDVNSEAPEVWTVTLAPPEGKQVKDYLPGQFHFIRFFRGRGLPVEEHHWTISSSPARKDSISSTIKNLGDFTSTIGETKAGDLASVHGPFGRFSHVLHPQEKDLVFFAGGIGITPLMSMIRYMRDVQDTSSILLFYANRKENLIVFKDELARIEEEGYPRLRTVHVLNNPDEGWQGETGLIDEKMIEKHCNGNLEEKGFYVCGPPPMLQSIVSSLLDLGVDDKKIRIELFSFLD